MDSEQATEKHPGPEFEEDRKDNSLFLLGELKVASKMGASTKGHWSVESSELLNPTQPRCLSEIRAGLGLVTAPSTITGQRSTRITVQCCPDSGTSRTPPVSTRAVAR
uniref:uncharacterized protein LOC125406294 isoform X3 n=1 Tax=Myodes glareolus TaxID=447135 RepID=UPI002020ABC0|nr:uncharacterized protein LOC125406294 isoform X3 [Myodes glareolus]